MLAVLNIALGILLGVGAVQELYVRGLVNGEPQPFAVGLAGAVAALLLVLSGVGLVMGWTRRRTWVLVAAAANLLFLVYAALPPHRNVGIGVLLLGAGYSLLLLARFRAETGPAAAGG